MPINVPGSLIGYWRKELGSVLWKKKKILKWGKFNWKARNRNTSYLSDSLLHANLIVEGVALR